MNKLLSLLGRKSISIVQKLNYKKIILTYYRKKSIMYKKVKKWNYKGEILENYTQEKALGGSNGDDIFNYILYLFREKVREENKSRRMHANLSKSELDRLFYEELEKNDIDLSMIYD